MQLFIQLLLFLFLLSCGTKNKETDKELTSEIDSIDATTTEPKFVHHDTVQINNISLVETIISDHLHSVSTLGGDTVVTAANYYFKATYPDIDEDGFKDIRVFVFSQMPNQAVNYLYDNQTNRFLKIENSDLDIKKLKGTNFYFSYNSVGCSDASWESHLCKIENFKEIVVGRIDARGCGDNDTGIYIYKVEGDKETLVQTMPMDKNKNGENKWHFIEKHWTNHYKLFDQ